MEQKSPIKEQNESRTGGKGAMATLVVLTLLLMINYADRSILNIALQPIKVTFNLTDTEAGGLVSLFTLGIAIFTIPISIVGDRWVRSRLVGILALIWSFFTLCTGLATATWQLFISRFMVGAGEAGYATAGVAWLALVFKQGSRSRVMSIFTIGGGLGAFMGLVIGGWIIATTHDWRMAFYVFAVPGMILAISAFFLTDYKSARKKDESFLSSAFFKGFGSVFKIKSYVLSTVGICLFHFTVQAATAWTPALLMRAYNMSPLNAGLAYGLTSLIGVVTTILGGFWADKWYKRSARARPYMVVIAMAVNLLVTFITFFFLVNISLPWFLVGVSLMALTYGFHLPPYLSIASDITPLPVRITAIGLGNFIMHVFGATLGPLLAGIISDTAGGGARGIQIGVTSMLAISVFGVIAYAMLLKYYVADSAKIIDHPAAA